jgi:hypothetical protein
MHRRVCLPCEFGGGMTQRGNRQHVMGPWLLLDPHQKIPTPPLMSSSSSSSPSIMSLNGRRRHHHHHQLNRSKFHHHYHQTGWRGGAGRRMATSSQAAETKQQPNVVRVGVGVAILRNEHPGRILAGLRKGSHGAGRNLEIGDQLNQGGIAIDDDSWAIDDMRPPLFPFLTSS